MSEILIDPLTGNAMRINSSNQALTAAVTVEEVTHISSVAKRTFQFHSERTIVAGYRLTLLCLVVKMWR